VTHNMPAVQPCCQQVSAVQRRKVLPARTAPSAATSGGKSAEESYRALWGGDEFEASERGTKLRAKFEAQYSDATSASMPANGVLAPSLRNCDLSRCYLKEAADPMAPVAASTHGSSDV
jgi:hypothetical protein